MTTEVRDKLLDAAEHLMQTRGLARISTRDITRGAGLAEGTLYNHFKDKHEIFLAVIQRHVPKFSEALQTLPFQVGQRTVRENLEEVAEKTLDFHKRTAPLISSLFGDQEMLTQNRRVMQQQGIGPDRSLKLLATYLAAEQRLGRIAAGVNSEVAAELLLGTIFESVVRDHFLGRELNEAQTHERLTLIVKTLMQGLEPRLGSP